MNRLPNPVRLRSVIGKHVGTTAFFRNRPLLRRMLNEIKKTNPDRFSILFHACSAGAEVYSFLIAWHLDPDLKQIPIECHATDIEPSFLETAALGVFPGGVLSAMEGREKSFFEKRGNNIRIDSGIRQLVQFQPPSSFVDFEAHRKYDAVSLLNALIYVDPEVQEKTISSISKYNNKFLIITGFHADKIKSDLILNGYYPVTEGAEEIHNSWVDRRVKTDGSELIPGVIYHPYSLDEFSHIDDWEYKICSVFKK